ncbi:MAG: 30S ribosomal protein S17 [Gammaproteobacteria bacterium]|nr:30S ribosomal protein S17 [Gammaproteobacteria bacterium]
MSTHAKVLTGQVVSAKRDKTITVKVVYKAMDRKYKKYLTRSTKLHAHDEDNICAEGDVVSIKESRPISKTKNWQLLEIVEKSK